MVSRFNKATIKDVAEKAGVSISTVSRMLSGNYPIGDQTRQNILNAISETNYQPNVLARSLKSGRTKMIGVVVANMANRFFMQLARGIETFVEPLEYNLIISSTYNDRKKEERVLSMLTERAVDAIVLASSIDDPKCLEKIVTRNTPLILIERRVPGIQADMVLEDNYASGYKLMKLVTDNGHRRIAFVNGIESHPTTKENFAGFKSALDEKNIEIDRRYIIKGDLDKTKAYEGIKKLFKTLPKEEWPTAVASMSGLMTESTMHALRELDLRIPEDVSVVSYGELSSDLISPRITSIKQDANRMGKKAAELVLERLEEVEKDVTNRHYREILFGTEIVIGESIKRING